MIKPWQNPAPDASVPMVPSGDFGTITVSGRGIGLESTDEAKARVKVLVDEIETRLEQIKALL